jgi:hypothetical protein
LTTTTSTARPSAWTGPCGWRLDSFCSS